MVKKNGESEILRCSFCNKDQNDVRKLIAGPTAVSYTHLTLPTKA